MTPPATVSGLYFAHADADYFNLGEIGRDQIEDYAARKGMSVEEVERWLAPALAYDPAPPEATPAEVPSPRSAGDGVADEAVDLPATVGER